jgi:hypothetical protein
MAAKAKDLSNLTNQPLEQPLMGRVRQAALQIKADDTIWKSNVRTARGQWIKQGLPRPTSKRAVDVGKLDPSMRPLGSLIVYPVNDPYSAQQRAMFRMLIEENSWILRANVIIQKLVVTTSSSDIEPRKDMEIEEEALEKWQQEAVFVPYFERIDRDDPNIGRKDKGMRTPNEIKEWIDRIALKLDLQSIIFNAYLIMREQGRCVIGMFPEVRDENHYYQIPQTIRISPPEFTRRPVLNFDTGELEAIEITGLTSNGGHLDANRAIYLMNSDNLNLFSDFYGRSQLRPLLDIGKVLLTIYGSDFPHAAEFTWHQPKVFKHTFPARDIAKGETHLKNLMDNFNLELHENQGKDVSITQATEEVSTGTNSGDISGLIEIQNECIDAIAAFYNIPPFLLAKGKPGRLGGNANREEIDSFLNVEIRPEQEILENIVEKQFYDRILAILFDVEPASVSDARKVPVKMTHNFEKPDLAAAINIEQYEILKDMVAEGLITTEKMMEKLGVRELLDDNTTGGEDATPSIKTWVRRNPHWMPGQAKSSKWKNWKPQTEFKPAAKIPVWNAKTQSWDQT